MPTQRQRIRSLVIARHGRKCYYCTKTAYGKSLQIDHVVPRAANEPNVDSLDNLVPACAACNKRKGKQSLALYIERRLPKLKAERDRLLAVYAEHVDNN